MVENKQYQLPIPVINRKESESLDLLADRYNKLTQPNRIVRIGEKAKDLIPDGLINFGSGMAENISSFEIYQRAMEIASDGFKVLEEQLAVFTISEQKIIHDINSVSEGNEITELSEICLVRSYDICKLVQTSKGKERIAAIVEGGVTGVGGLWGIPFNLALSTLLYFRAVQLIALYYGYDVKNDSAELIIASEVFTSSLSPAKNSVNNELNGVISKVMLMTQSTVVKQTAKKTWTDMATRGGVPLLLTQMRALANKAAQRALENAGAKGLEQSVFKETFEQIGRKLTLKTVQKAVPFVSAALSALIDTAQMDRVLKFADIFYQKRFILEKESRIAALINADVVG